MSDLRPNPTIVRESPANGGILFVLGAIVVAIAVLLWFVLGGGTSATPDKGVTKTNVTIEAPAEPAPAATAPAAPAPAAPAPAEPAAPAAPATNP